MKKAYLFAILVLFAVSVTAQNSKSPWLIGISTNYADFEAVEMPVSDQLTDANWMGKTLPSQLKIARLLNKSFVFGAEFSTLTIEPDKLNLMPTETFVTTDKMWRIGGQFEYKFANGYLLKEDSWFDPYLFLGANGTNINEKTYLAQSSGVGFNIWFTDWFGVNAQGSYDYIFDWNDYFHYSFGLVFKFGKKPDRDGDGIPDHLDECPDVPGLAQFNGCPDSDGDGIPDHLDECPDEPGLARFNGCPDRDGDGIPDHLDECPDVPGLAQFNGCPDTDGDGIPDHLDDCPNEPGPASNRGCPIAEEVIEAINFHAQSILFETSSATIKQASFRNLDEIVAIMTQYPDTRFTVHGHTDITGPAEFNLQLSKDRAKSVADYFTGKGIDAGRLDVDGFGITKPIAPNNTAEGRTQNRRVDIKLIN